jgi:hypothetical protein
MDFKTMIIRKLVINESSSFNELDFLLELFSFFTSVTSENGGQVCRWWSDLLSKDSLILAQVSKNKDSNEAFQIIQKKVGILYEQSKILKKMRDEVNYRRRHHSFAFFTFEIFIFRPFLV